MVPIARAARLFAFVCLALTVAPAARSQSADFYAGKQIRLAVSTAPGGGYDTYARALAPFLTRHIPGHPSVIVENMPGASGVKVASFLYAVAPRDGTVIGGTHSEAIVAPLTMP